MLPLLDPSELSTAIDGKLWTRSLPTTWSMVKKSVVRFCGELHVVPLSEETAKPILLLSPPGNRDQAIYTLEEPLPANRGMAACPSVDVLATTVLVDHVGGVARILSENVVEISTPAGANVAEVKLVQ